MLGVIANQVAISHAERAHVRAAGGAGDHRRAHRPRQPPHLPGALRDDAGPRRAATSFAVSLLLTDIDHFKKVNDTYGHPTGDEVLRRVAAILKRERAQDRHRGALRRRGVRHRARGDRPRRRAPARRAHPHRRSSSRASSRSKGAFKAHAVARHRQLPRRRPREGRDLIAHADQSLYAAKHGGRNRTVCFSDIDRAKPKLAAAK